MKQALALMLLCLCSVFGVSAQTIKSISPKVSVIDGKENPSQIPDAIAYRLYFYVLTNEAQRDNVAALGLDVSDTQTAIRILNDFKTEDEQIRGSHDLLAANKHADVVSFQNERDSLVDNTRKQLRQSLSIDGMASLDNAVQINKTQIKLTIGQTQSLATSSTLIANAALQPPPPINPPPTCTHIQSLTWTPSVAETATYSVGSSNSSTTSVNSNVVYDGFANFKVTWPSGCIPGPFVAPKYTPKVYNVQNGVGGWTTGTPVVAGAEFNYGNVVTVSISTEQILNQSSPYLYNGGFGNELDGSESSENLNFVILIPIEVVLQFEAAYERTATIGGRSGCVTNPANGITTCVVSQTAWCNPRGTPPDLNITKVVTETYPLSPAPFFEHFAACKRAIGGVWSCSPALSLPNFNGASSLGFCTKTP